LRRYGHSLKQLSAEVCAQMKHSAIFIFYVNGISCFMVFLRMIFFLCEFSTPFRISDI
jgi:hypothetical protein